MNSQLYSNSRQWCATIFSLIGVLLVAQGCHTRPPGKEVVWRCANLGAVTVAAHRSSDHSKYEYLYEVVDKVGVVIGSGKLGISDENDPKMLYDMFNDGNTFVLFRTPKSVSISLPDSDTGESWASRVLMETAAIVVDFETGTVKEPWENKTAIASPIAQAHVAEVDEGSLQDMLGSIKGVTIPPEANSNELLSLQQLPSVIGLNFQRPIVDADVDLINGITSIDRINLMEANMNDSDLNTLERLEGVKTIVLPSDRVSSAAVDSLRKSLPSNVVVRAYAPDY